MPMNLNNVFNNLKSLYGRNVVYLYALRIIRTYFHNITGKFFVEAGAMDGEYISNTLYLEVSFEMKK